MWNTETLGSSWIMRAFAMIFYRFNCNELVELASIFSRWTTTWTCWLKMPRRLPVAVFHFSKFSNASTIRFFYCAMRIQCEDEQYRICSHDFDWLKWVSFDWENELRFSLRTNRCRWFIQIFEIVRPSKRYSRFITPPISFIISLMVLRRCRLQKAKDQFGVEWYLFDAQTAAPLNWTCVAFPMNQKP